MVECYVYICITLRIVKMRECVCVVEGNVRKASLQQIFVAVFFILKYKGCSVMSLSLTSNFFFSFYSSA